VHCQDEVVRGVERVIRSADFGEPDRDAPLEEAGRDVEELHAVEGALRFADHDGVPTAVRTSGVTQ
jgi:hypothetical protein